MARREPPARQASILRRLGAAAAALRRLGRGPDALRRAELLLKRTARGLARLRGAEVPRRPA